MPLRVIHLKQAEPAADLLHIMRTLLIATVVSLLLCAWQTSSVMQASAATTSSNTRLDLAVEEEPEEEGQEGEDQAGGSTEAGSAASAEAEGEEEGEGTAGADRSRPGHGHGSHSSHGTHFAVVSRLGLTAKANTALRQGTPVAASLSFSFTLSASAKLQVTLVEQVAGRSGTYWTPTPDSVVLGAHRGRDTVSLSGHNRLSAGRYRLTLKPVGGRPRSIYLTARGQ